MNRIAANFGQPIAWPKHSPGSLKDTLADKRILWYDEDIPTSAPDFDFLVCQKTIITILNPH